MKRKRKAREILGENVVQLRAFHGWTQEHLAEKAELDRRYVQRIEAGVANPGVDVLSRLKTAFDCEWDDLLG